MRFSLMCFLVVAVGGLGCAAGADDAAGRGDDDASSGGADAGSGGSGGSGLGSGSGGEGGDPSLGGAGSGGAPTGLELLCDGIDNDNNGVVDDVDKGKDGVCDCLRLATLGVKGKYGQGDVFANWLNARSDFGAVSLGTTELTAGLLDQFEVIVAQDLSVGFGGYDAVQAAAVETWVEAGGGLMTLIGYEDEYSVNNVNELLAPMGMGYGSNKIMYDGIVTSWIPHPVTNGVTLMHIGNGYPVQGPGTMLANGEGHNVLQATDVGSGRVLMWADEWITYDSEWLSHPEYQVETFWLNIIKYLTPPGECQVPPPVIE